MVGQDKIHRDASIALVSEMFAGLDSPGYSVEGPLNLLPVPQSKFL
jgi:hypothetical protein